MRTRKNVRANKISTPFRDKKAVNAAGAIHLFKAAIICSMNFCEQSQCSGW